MSMSKIITRQSNHTKLEWSIDWWPRCVLRSKVSKFVLQDMSRLDIVRDPSSFKRTNIKKNCMAFQADISKKLYRFFNIRFYIARGIPNNIQSRHILNSELWYFRFKNPPCEMMIRNFGDIKSGYFEELSSDRLSI